MNNGAVRSLLNRRHWWIYLSVVLLGSLLGLTYLGVDTYEGAPPVADFTTPDGTTVIERETILRGKKIFHRRGLMDYGSFFGDGAARGPDFTADALHRTATSMRSFYEKKLEEEQGRALTENDRGGVAARVRREIHRNGWNPETDRIHITPAQAQAYRELIGHYRDMFTEPHYGEAFQPTGYLSDPDAIRALTAYFFWGGWVSGANRPGEDYSYTHNWPHDPAAGNTPTGPNILWSLLAIIGLFLGIGGVLYLYGQFKDLPGDPFDPDRERPLTTDDLEDQRVYPSQRATYKFFALAVVLFFLQVVAGVITVGDFVSLGGWLGVDLQEMIPVTVARSWHIMVQIFWFFLAWIGYSIFFLPVLSGEEVRGQRFLTNLLFVLCAVTGLGTFAGIYLGPLGYLPGGMAYWFGSQGWEFMELGRFWQFLMLAAFVLWTVIIYRGVKPYLSHNQWSLPAWLFYSVAGMVFFFFFGLMVTPETNFAIADFWRWMVVHMWVEATFEVFTTVVVAYLLVLMHLTSRRMAERTIFLAVILFLATSLVGIAHNFYWIAKPESTLALGSVFSTLQVLPLLLLTLDAWRLQKQPERARERHRTDRQKYVMEGVWLFILATNFWNVVGAGLFGSIINLPIVNYFEHATYLTVNHAHAAMFGVKGNVALAGVLFCCQHLFQPAHWNRSLIRTVFWSLNGGLVLMMLLNLFPVGLYQFWVVVQKGLWFARSQEFILGIEFQTFTWLRSVGGTLFLLGGVLPLTWFILSRGRRLNPANITGESP